MSEQVNWEEYVQEQQLKLEQSAAHVQQLMDSQGISVSAVLTAAQTDPATIDPAVLQEIVMRTGKTLEDLVGENPPVNASRFAQKTRALRV